ncbi:MAG: hydroxyethylthiazole kinase [Endomicrobium sp.]|jgi:hydroxyethylthiazole kinase|nr:hydroxyethylthiazole kinase [Endomicrobium sp.]
MEKVLSAVVKAVNDAKETSPLSGSWTNFTTINLVANAQLAVGGRAATCFLPDEAKPIAAISKSIYINAGTLKQIARESLTEAAKAAVELGKPWVLDPVAAGLGATRNALLKDLKPYKPTIIRGNASEVITLANFWELQTAKKGNVEGVDATDTVYEALESAKELAKWTGGTVTVSGKTDLVLNNKEIYAVSGGSDMLKKITGGGCSLGGVIAVYAAVAEPLIAALTGSVVYKWASETAANSTKGSFSFQTAFIDNLSLLDAETIRTYAETSIRKMVKA